MNRDAVIRWAGWLRGPSEANAVEQIRLRRWFYAFTAWLAALAILACACFRRFEAGDAAAQALWLWSLTLFYLSLCCVFFPFPTSWIVLLLASNQVGLLGSAGWRVAVVAGSAALATALANLNEYHLFTFLLRYGWAARVRDARAYRRAAAWFAAAPFGVLVVFSFLPIPVDVVRWLAIATRYSRMNYFAAYFVGRGTRYAVLAASAVWLDLRWWTILMVQGGLVLLFALKAGIALLRRRAAAEAQLAPAAAAT